MGKLYPPHVYKSILLYHFWDRLSSPIPIFLYSAGQAQILPKILPRSFQKNSVPFFSEKDLTSGNKCVTIRLQFSVTTFEEAYYGKRELPSFLQGTSSASEGQPDLLRHYG